MVVRKAGSEGRASRHFGALLKYPRTRTCCCMRQSLTPHCGRLSPSHLQFGAGGLHLSLHSTRAGLGTTNTPQSCPGQLKMSSDERPPAQQVERPKPTRYCFRVRVEQIPGPPLGRSITLANDFMLPRFNREFDWDRDYVYTPVRIDQTGSQWLLLDIDKDLHPLADSRTVDLAVFRVSAEAGVL